MLEFYKSYENFDIRIPYRIKSRKSIFDKLVKYLVDDKKSKYEFNSMQEYQGSLKDELSDILAITVVSCNRPPTFYSNDPQINELIEEKKRNHALLGKMQKFKLACTVDEFSGANHAEYNYECSRMDYYLNSIMLVERMKTLIDPKATNLLKRCDVILDSIKKNVPEDFYNICKSVASDQNLAKKMDSVEKVDKMYDYLKANIKSHIDSQEEIEFLNSPITDKDTKTVDFLKILTDFTSRIHDKLDLAILTKQVSSVFENSELIKRFGITVDKGSEKEKREKSGYVSNFMFLNTPFGKVELQLQTQHENMEANIGYAAHCNMPGKQIKEIEIPKDRTDEKAMDDFRTAVEIISPKKFLAQYDNSESNRILVQKFGKYQNYKSVTSQVRKGTSTAKRIEKYFGELYKIRTEVFPDEAEQEMIESFIYSDIDEYLKSDEFKRIKLLKKKAEKQETER
jgi:hypothetical protein